MKSTLVHTLSISHGTISHYWMPRTSLGCQRMKFEIKLTLVTRLWEPTISASELMLMPMREQDALTRTTAKMFQRLCLSSCLILNSQEGGEPMHFLLAMEQFQSFFSYLGSSECFSWSGILSVRKNAIILELFLRMIPMWILKVLHLAKKGAHLLKVIGLEC